MIDNFLSKAEIFFVFLFTINTVLLKNFDWLAELNTIIFKDQKYSMCDTKLFSSVTLIKTLNN